MRYLSRWTAKWDSSLTAKRTTSDAVLLSEGEYIAVPRGVRYRFAAYRNTVRLLEISFGLYDQVFDIERFSDDYGRVGKLGDI